MDGKLLMRSTITAFLEIEPQTFVRMQGFTSFATKKNPHEYSRQYIDETHEQTDVMGYSPEIEFSFDRYVGNAVHDKIAKIIDSESIGNDAIVNILLVDGSVDMSGIGAANINAHTRLFSVIADKEGDNFDAYTYSGTFAVKGEKIWGRGQVLDNGVNATFIAVPTV